MYLTLSGSIGYGTNLDSSDIDLRGITIERKENMYGFQSFEQFEDTVTDTVIYMIGVYSLGDSEKEFLKVRYNKHIACNNCKQCAYLY
ncbi:nucleotidyltransferase domain-containing protein [Clostridium sp. Maddingley MBC34-26]|uniref:DNA polymerase beta superfamily protein n=1 Tax=Clostridium sp. Maddingley MBC34-26 TaxID=1196322 RepID=UPI00241F4D00|nr:MULTISPECIES: nucleotidyltransferase domain-containing protein [unclassified Clostridium]